MPENVEVGTSSVPEQFTTVIRYLATSASGYALGAGWINGEVQQALISIVGILTPLAWGWVATRRNKSLKIAVASGAKTLSLKGGQ